MYDALLEPSDLPFQLPDFAAIDDADFVPAIRAAMADHAAEVAAIVANPQPATVDNTCIALEASGQSLARATLIFFGVFASDARPEREAALDVLAPELDGHYSAIWSDPQLLTRIEAAAANDAAAHDAETRALIERQLRDLRRGGAALDDDRRAELLEIDTRLGTLSATFGKNLMASTKELAVHLTVESDLAGLGAAERAGLAEAAREQGLDGWLITLDLPTVQPISAQLDSAQVRRAVAEASLRRGRTDGADNTEIVLEMVRLRARRAALLGYPSHAAYVLEVETAKTPEAARGLLDSLTDAAATNARGEAKDLLGGAEGEVHPADWAYLSRALRAERFAVSEDEVRPYFPLERVLQDGVFYAAGELYGLEFHERPDLHGFLPDVRVVEVRRAGVAGDEGSVGLILLDYFHRPTKRGGAWMTEFVPQSRLLGTKPVVINVMNIARPAAGEQALLTADEVETMFHEFGHGLHGLLSQVTYPTFAGTNVPRDFVEFPSQINEMWADDDAVLDRCTRDPETGTVLPVELRARIREAATFGEGQATVEYLGAALIDLAWHSLSPEEAAAVTDIDAFEAAVLAEAGLDIPGIEPRYRSRYFQHIFGGGYAAAYYAYIWAEVLAADGAEAIREGGGLSAAAATGYAREILTRGGSIDFGAAYRAFRGADPSPEPLLRKRGLESSVV